MGNQIITEKSSDQLPELRLQGASCSENYSASLYTCFKDNRVEVNSNEMAMKLRSGEKYSMKQQRALIKRLIH